MRHKGIRIMTIRNAGKFAGAIVLSAGLAACATPGPNASIFGAKVAHDEIGLATRAQAALVNGEYDTAINYAEKAVAGSPNDAGFRALLGNAYFASGRFASADMAYADSLAILPAQPQIILKRSLVMIAQGRGDAAVSLLDTAQGYVSESDRGLALALAGRHQSAIAVLDNAARSASGDARTRQNLALAYALSGDWNNARAIAAQDVPADQLDARLSQWRTMAAPSHSAQQVAALTGVTPAAIDPGQPTRLALNPQAVPQQRAATVTAPIQLQPAPSVSTQAIAANQAVSSPNVANVPPAAVQPFTVARAETGRIEAAERPAANVRYTEVPVIEGDFEEADTLAPLPAQPAAESAIMTPADIAAMPVKMAEAKATPSAGLSSDATRFTQSAASITAAAEALKGDSQYVVQLGAYNKRADLDMGWAVATENFSPISKFKPMAARADINGKKYYRLAAWGFAGDAEARDFCMSIKQAGGDCWVREVAGDAPFQLASR